MRMEDGVDWTMTFSACAQQAHSRISCLGQFTLEESRIPFEGPDASCLTKGETHPDSMHGFIRENLPFC